MLPSTTSRGRRLTKYFFPPSSQPIATLPTYHVTSSSVWRHALPSTLRTRRSSIKRLSCSLRPNSPVTFVTFLTYSVETHTADCSAHTQIARRWFAVSRLKYGSHSKHSFDHPSPSYCLTLLTLWWARVIIVPHRTAWSWYNGWAVSFGTARRGLGGATARPSPFSMYQM